MDDSSTDRRRIAVIAVHGVADQQPGATARSVADLLVAAAPAGTHYCAVALDSFTLPVPALAPKTAHIHRNVATPTHETRTVWKSFRQSLRSDFQRANWEAPESSSQEAQWASERAAAARADAVGGGDSQAGDADRGVAVTNYLLAKQQRNGGAREAYRSDCLRLTRAARGRARTLEQVDVYEMYWADLSRLSGAIPRIVTELFTMIFRLSKLGRETVDEARRQALGASGKAPWAWNVVAACQIALDWGFVNLLALLFAQLGMLALAIAPFALFAADPALLDKAVAVSLVAFGVVWWFYHRRDVELKWLVAIAAVAAGSVLASYPPSAFWILGASWFSVLTLGYCAFLKIADDRFPLVRAMGLALWALALALMVGRAIWLGHSQATLQAALQTPAAAGARVTIGLAAWAQAGLFAIEYTLRAIEVWWVVLTPLLVVWLVCGLLAARQGGYRASASVGTGRIGFFISLTSFTVIAMAAWALSNTALERVVATVGYDQPSTFSAAEVASRQSDAASAAQACECRMTGAAPAGASAASAGSAAAATAASGSSAQRFVRARYEDTAAYFSLLAALLLLVAVDAAAVFLPSVLAELNLLAARVRAGSARKTPRAAPGAARQEAQRLVDLAAGIRLGRWLSAGYRHLDATVLAIVAIAIVVSALVGFVLLLPFVSRWNFVPETWRDCVARLSLMALEPFVLSAAGVVAAVTALGGVLSRYAPSLRAPLDIALDVDNHFREFPRSSIPRARIFSRFKALLDHVAAQGYSRIVIVSHSQGSVISAELLRFLSDSGSGDGGADDAAARRRRLRKGLGTDVRLLTLGCPLRQLYAARFPWLYGWVTAWHALPGAADVPGPGDEAAERMAPRAINGPLADDIGVEVWANAYTSGDYVGRWLWSSPGTDPVLHPMIDTVQHDRLGRTDAYSPFHPMPPHAGRLDTAREFEMCLGLGAHTHYLEPDQSDVAWLIDHLIESPTRQRR